jgi:alpha-beta hydrolase superfamily lysophospholipase
MRAAPRFLFGTVKQVARALGYGLVGGFLVLVVLFVVVLERRADLEIWHTIRLEEEFTADSPVTSLDGYLTIEERLYAEIDREIYGATEPVDHPSVDRFRRGSLSDPARWPRNWNRSVALTADKPRAGVLLLHGLSDSPYSMRSLAESLHAAGGTVLAMRLPGHGTAPSGLVYTEYEDWMAAAAVGMRHLHATVGDQPLYIVGYSNGGAVAVLYALAAIEDPSLPLAAGLVLMSPEIAITKMAVFAQWQDRLGRLLGLRKLAWTSILPEYDPFKYQSFALNAGRQARRITLEIQSQITALAKTGDLDRFPPLLAFQSVVDATVLAPALAKQLFGRLPPGDHEVVLFDLNRVAGIEPIYKQNPRAGIEALLADPTRTYAVSLVTNENENSRAGIVRRVDPGDASGTVTPLGVSWPQGVYSLSHVALPFPVDDPLYGDGTTVRSPGIQIGGLVLRGERGVLKIEASDILRMRWNPFHAYLRQRTLEFTGLEGEHGDHAGE